MIARTNRILKIMRFLYIFLFLSITLNLQAQVTGVVKDTAGEPIPGANVFWINTTEGATTNEDGNFSIHKPARSHLLVVSFIGFENDTVHVDKGNQQLEIVLREGVELGEVNIVTRKMGTMKLRSSVMNEDMISSAELTRAACCNLGESFVTNPSVDVSYSDAATGAKQIKLLGLSGTYVQMIPYIYSVDAEGNEYNFLADYYRTTQELASNIFRKGYQWPFHATRVMDFGSSLLDMAVAQEQQSGRQVFMDFNRNPEAVPGDLPFSLDRLDDDVRAYLENNDALAPSPIERLQRMNPLSISLYKMHGYDLTTQPLQFAMNNQHMNGGIEVDIWGQTSLPGCFAVGEVAGTHGVTRPGGAALNAGQVFAVRLARFIGCTQKRNIDGDIAQLVAPTLASIREIITQAHDNGTGMPLSVVREKIQARMSDHAGFICHADKVRRATRDALLLSEFVQRHGLAIKHVGEVAELFMWRHMALTSAAVLTQLTHYIDAGGGSRGARIILDRDGNSIPQTRNGFCDAWRFRSERTEDKKDKLLIHYCNGIFHVRETPVREFPIIRGIWFEKNWPGFLNGTIYQPQDE